MARQKGSGAMNRLRAARPVGVVLLMLAAGGGGCLQEATSSERRSPQREHQVGGKVASQVFADRAVSELAMSACRGDVGAVKVATAGGVDPNARGLEGVTPLIWALNCRNLSGVRALLEAGADPNLAVDGDSFTAVGIAARMKDPRFLELLLMSNGDPNAVYAGGGTALDSALAMGIQTQDWKSYYLLIESGADINRVYEGENTGEVAALLNQFDKLYELLDMGLTTNLDTIAGYIVYKDLEGVPPEQRVWMDKVSARLRARGVVFPDPPPTDG